MYREEDRTQGDGSFVYRVLVHKRTVPLCPVCVLLCILSIKTFWGTISCRKIMW